MPKALVTVLIATGTITITTSKYLFLADFFGWNHLKKKLNGYLDRVVVSAELSSAPKDCFRKLK